MITKQMRIRLDVDLRAKIDKLGEIWERKMVYSAWRVW